MAQWLTDYQYGNGGDGAYAPATSTDTPVDSSCSGSSGTTSLSATNAGFASNQIILIHQTRGTGADAWELNVISSYVAGTITTKYNLANTYTDSGASQAQVLVVKQYSSALIDTGVTLTTKAWTGDVGGILVFMCNGITTITGTIATNGTAGALSDNNAAGGGFGGGDGIDGSSDRTGYEGEGTSGAGDTRNNAANGNGGGGGVGATAAHGGGGGGGNGAVGTVGDTDGAAAGGTGGAVAGAANLTTMAFGGGGGQGGFWQNQYACNGGNGGGMVLIISNNLAITGAINSNGGAGRSVTGAAWGSGAAGGGAGGSVLILGNILTLGTNLITVAAGAGGTHSETGINGGAGSVGRIAVDYGTSYTGSTTPALTATQDNNLVPSSPGDAMMFSGGLAFT